MNLDIQNNTQTREINFPSLTGFRGIIIKHYHCDKCIVLELNNVIVYLQMFT